ncbi:hypothetical protein KSS87_022327 [Heliosperma pusillum]|nr:hypothetical protein KSS87_022327 [Heliosperma pusillum]
MASLAATSDFPVPMAAKKGRSKKALKDKKSSTSEANILAGNQSTDAVGETLVPVFVPEPEKENNLEMSERKNKKKKSKSKAKGEQQEEVVEKASSGGGNGGDFEKQLQEMQEMMEKMKIEKEKTEEMLKEKDEILKKKDEEIKKLHKIKEFKPTMTLPIMQSMKGKEIEKQDKKKKDCPERKRPASAYALWCKDVYSEIKKENPEADFKDMSNLLSVKWKSLTPEEKKPYDEQYQAEKEAYLKVVSKEKRESEAMKLLEDEHKQKTAIELLDQYLQYVQEAADKGTKKSKKEKDPSKPKQPVGAFFLYSNERRAALLGEGKKLLEASKIAGEEWKNMTAEQKRPYEEVAKVNKEKYQEEMELYKQKKEEETANLKKEEEELMKIHKVEALQLLKKKEKTENIIKQTKDLKKKQKEEKVVDPNKPKRPTSSFFLFRYDIRSLNTELSDEEKKIWNDKAAEGMEAYKKELEEYNKQQAEAATTV